MNTEQRGLIEKKVDVYNDLHKCFKEFADICKNRLSFSKLGISFVENSETDTSFQMEALGSKMLISFSFALSKTSQPHGKLVFERIDGINKITFWKLYLDKHYEAKDNMDGLFYICGMKVDKELEKLFYYLMDNYIQSFQEKE